MLKLPRWTPALVLLVLYAQGCGAKKDSETDLSNPENASFETEDGLNIPPPVSGEPDSELPDSSATTDQTTSPAASNPSLEAESWLQAFSLQGLTDNTVTNNLAISWTSAAGDQVSYTLRLATDELCETAAYEYAGVTSDQVNLGDIEDGSYFVCLSAHYEAEVRQATNSGIQVNFDTTAPQALESFTISPVSIAQPLGSSATRLGVLRLVMSFPTDTDDYSDISLRYSETVIGSCSDGNDMPLGTVDFGDDFELDLNLSPGKTYHFLACISDAAGNIRQVALESPSVEVPADQRVFVSSEAFSGNLAADYNANSFATGLEGADARCQGLATDAGLGGLWKAILSDDNNSAKDRIVLHEGAVVDVMGNTIHSIATGIWLGLDAGIGLDETGQNVGIKITWTATSVGGESRVGSSCDNWSSSEALSTGGYGFSNSTAANEWLGSAGALGCSNLFQIYCIEQSMVP